MTSEIAAAAERWRSGTNYSQCPDDWPDCRDAWKLADAAIAAGMFQADDAEPVTEDWLRSSGFYPAESYGGDGGTWNKNIGGSDDDTICFNLTTMKSELWVGSRYISIPGSTRGDVRRLLAALKITLTEKDAHVQ